MNQVSDFYDSAHRPSLMLEELRAVWRYRDLLAQLIARNLTVRYKRSILGFAWTMLNPLLMMTILTLVFSNVFRVTLEHYAVYVLSALVLWNFFAQATSAAMSELAWGSGLFQRIYMPRAIFVLAAIGTNLVNLLLAMIPLAVIMLATGVPFRPALLFLPVPIGLTALFALGIGLVLAVLAVSFADIVDIYQVALTAWLYLTPIIYPPEIVPAQWRGLFALNPLYGLLELFRQPIYAGVLPAFDLIVAMSALAFGVVAFGWWFFARNVDGLAYRI
ncbi:MAG: ABC transporter permease [Chloroflexi bacterium]|nr:ABC transporter permease [Chloroflexota bacterium]